MYNVLLGGTLSSLVYTKPALVRLSALLERTRHDVQRQAQQECQQGWRAAPLILPATHARIGSILEQQRHRLHVQSCAVIGLRTARRALLPLPGLACVAGFSDTATPPHPDTLRTLHLLGLRPAVQRRWCPCHSGLG